MLVDVNGCAENVLNMDDFIYHIENNVGYDFADYLVDEINENYVNAGVIYKIYDSVYEFKNYLQAAKDVNRDILESFISELDRILLNEI